MKYTREDLLKFRGLLPKTDTNYEILTELLIKHPALSYVCDLYDYPGYISQVNIPDGHDCWGKSEFYTQYFVYFGEDRQQVFYDGTVLVCGSDDKAIGKMYPTIDFKVLREEIKQRMTKNIDKLLP